MLRLNAPIIIAAIIIIPIQQDITIVIIDIQLFLWRLCSWQKLNTQKIEYINAAIALNFIDKKPNNTF